MTRRRVHLPHLQPGRSSLPSAEAHHVRDVLRLTTGDEVELFDAAGTTAVARLVAVSADRVDVAVDAVTSANRPAVELTVAAAVPKGDRADWMVEKLCELGVARFIPLVADRSVVVPAGRGKADRWERIAVEAAKQSRRTGVMAIGPVTPLANVIAVMSAGWLLSTDDASPPATAVFLPPKLTVLVGPEGGWTPAETAACRDQGWRSVRLTSTVLRVETAAVTAAAVVACSSP